MNIVLDTNKFSINYIYFLEKKKNIIIDGNFTKIIFSNQYFTMNCIYIKFPVELTKIEKNDNKNSIFYNPYNPNNLITIQDFTKIEFNIIEFYKKMNGCHKKVVPSLSKQLYSGIIKIYNMYRDYKEIIINNSNNNNNQYIIKISGIWETNNEIGITYKIYQI
jgi:hypothetical protein